MQSSLLETLAPPPGSSAKLLGAFYTDSQVADFLVSWAVRRRSDTVMDPSFGGGVFLRAACKRLIELGGRPDRQVWGVEVDAAVHARIADKLVGEFSVDRAHLLRSDFFAVDPDGLRVNAVVGNPPFIRYHRFAGAERKRALERAAAEGVRLSELCSSWAPFVVHSTAVLKKGGRLAMVLPFEVAHAAYALPILSLLRRSFYSVTLLTFRGRLFPDLSEDTLLLLAEGRGSAAARFYWRDLVHAGELAGYARTGDRRIAGTRQLDADGLSRGARRLIEYYLPEQARQLYLELSRLPQVQQLGALADVGIGYVTGANDFFHLGATEACARKIPSGYLRPAIRRGRSLSGLRLTRADWTAALASGEAGYLLHVPDGDDLPPPVRRYLDEGERDGVHLSYKCRTRKPWFRVPHVHQPDAFLSYMSGQTPRLVANKAGVVAPNSLHILRMHPEAGLNGDRLALLWQTSLTRLSAEIEGHALGGGLLKIEPTEAERVLVPVPVGGMAGAPALLGELDALSRRGCDTTVAERADEVILRDGLGLTRADCRLLREGASILRERRMPAKVSQ